MNRLALLAALLPTVALAGAPHLVRDVNPAVLPVDSMPTGFADQGPWSFFSANEGVQGLEPWATDGTLAGTVRLGAVNALPTGITGYRLVRAGSLTYFFSAGLSGFSALWSSDGTAAGTHPVIDLSSSGTNPSLVGALNGKVVFSLNEPNKGPELWISDGTAAGTHRIKSGGTPGSLLISDFVANDKIYFFANVTSNMVELWVTDGTDVGTRRIVQITNTAPQLNLPKFVQVDHYVLFNLNTVAEGTELWRLDVDTDAVSLLADTTPGTTSGIDAPQFGRLGSTALFFTAYSGGAPALWRSDGTPGGTALVANVRPSGSYPIYEGPTSAGRLLFVGDGGSGERLWATDGSTAIALNTTVTVLRGTIGGKTYFLSGPTPSNNPDLWSTDGTPAGTHKLTGFASGLSGNYEVAGSASQLYVRISRGNGVYEVYRYDTSTDTATLLRSYSWPLTQSSPEIFTFAQSRLYFDSWDAVTGREVWTSDGTASGTRLLRNIAKETRTQPSSPQNFFDFNGQLYFSADDGIVGRELWRSDGTAAGTQLVADVNPGPASSDPLEMFTLGNKLYFFAKNGANVLSYQLWTTDGTQAGTTLVAAAIPHDASGMGPCGAPVVTIGTRAYFSASNNVNGYELWTSDGTAAGTRRISDIAPGVASSAPCWLTTFQNRVFFAASLMLWSADGSGNAPSLVADINPGAFSIPTELQVLNGALYFLGTGPTNHPQLWKTDGTAAGTRVVSNIDTQTNVLSNLTTAGGKLFFIGGAPVAGTTGTPLWISDGTPAGTTQLTSGVLGPLHSDGTRAYFTAVDTSGAGYLAPWATDGTTAGTSLLTGTGTGLGGLIAFWDFRGATVIQAPSDLSSQQKLWRTDGTKAGTQLIGDINGSSISARPVTHLAVGRTFFYAADDGSSGAELFAIDNEVPLAGDDAGGTVQGGQSLTISVLANDSDPDGQVKADTVQVATQPTGGSVSVDGAGVITYAAKATFSGADQFTYTVADNQGTRSRPATVRVTVTAAPVTNPPTSPPTSPPTTTPSGGGGGGGALGLLEVLGLALVLGLRRARGCFGAGAAACWVLLRRSGCDVLEVARGRRELAPRAVATALDLGPQRRVHLRRRASRGVGRDWCAPQAHAFDVARVRDLGFQ